MISRDEFTAAFAQRLRFVLQKHEREMAARVGGNVPLSAANVYLDSAISELADFVFDALEAVETLNKRGRAEELAGAGS